MHLTVGVTGHRDLLEKEIPALRIRVREFFMQLGSEYPDLELQLISPLAEGADLLVAEIAIELGISLIVPLPMPRHEYEKDFSSDDAVTEFRKYLEKARVIDLRTMPEVAGRSLTSEDRDRQYAQMGVFISNHCQILLALWDGKPSASVGGTSGVVNYHLTAVMPGFSVAEESPNLLADNENDLAYHIVCSRNRPDGQPREDLKPLQTHWVTAHFGLEVGDSMPHVYQVMLQRLQDFDRDEEKYREAIEASGFSLLDDSPDMAHPSGIDIIDGLFRTADWLAIHFQKRVSMSLLVIHGLAVLVGLIFIVYSEYDGLDYLVNLFLVAFLVGFIIYKIGEKRHWHRKYLDYRALAEGLRVQVYWNLAGVIDAQSAEFAYDNFLQKQDVDLGWIRHVMRFASLSRSRTERPPPEWLDWVIAQWVGDEKGNSGQMSYYRLKHGEKIGQFRRTTLLGRASLWAGVLIAVWLAMMGLDMSDSLHNMLLVLMGILPLIAGVREAYSHKKAEKELIKQYRFMQGIFGNARRLLDRSDDDDFRRRILKALGSAALEEHAEWILMHRERPLEHSGI